LLFSTGSMDTHPATPTQRPVTFSMASSSFVRPTSASSLDQSDLDCESDRPAYMQGTRTIDHYRLRLTGGCQINIPLLHQAVPCWPRPPARAAPPGCLVPESSVQQLGQYHLNHQACLPSLCTSATVPSSAAAITRIRARIWKVPLDMVWTGLCRI
jgi:hypothetical protein